MRPPNSKISPVSSDYALSAPQGAHHQIVASQVFEYDASTIDYA
jgi:hypothetical protein